MQKRVCKGDVVLVLSGRDKGKRGKVLSVLPKKGLVKIEGVRIATRHTKARSGGQKGSIVQSEAYIPLCTVRAVEVAQAKRASRKAGQEQKVEG